MPDSPARPKDWHMTRNNRLLVFVAHPDDESFGCGSVIAAAASRGYDVAICTATLGEAGEPAPGYDLAGRDLGLCRLNELRTAAGILGARHLPPLGLADSGWDGPPAPDTLCATGAGELADLVGGVIRAENPAIVMTIAGDDGHRDHVWLRQAVHAAFATHAPAGASLYQWCLPNGLMRRWAEEVARLRPGSAHLGIAELGTGDETITTVIDTAGQLPRRRSAIAAHASQTSPYEGLSADLEYEFLTRDHLVRVVPPPTPGLRETWFMTDDRTD
jgi:LmbE family N-acetylglucosaminyl deacetylase